MAATEWTRCRSCGGVTCSSCTSCRGSGLDSPAALRRRLGELSPGDRRLRSGRYEVLVFLPKQDGRLRPVPGFAEPMRYATEAGARSVARVLAAQVPDVGVVQVCRLAPATNPGAPWTTTLVLELDAAEVGS